jgi:putative oxidoreductase
VRSFLFGGAGVGSAWGDVALLVLRVAAGIGLFTHGRMKLPPPERFVGMVGGLGFPLPELFAWCAALAESVGALLLAVGLLTRPAGAAIAVTMSVAFFGAHRNDAFSVKELAMLYGVIGLAFLLLGAGRLSLDRLAGGASGKRRR